MAKEFEVISIDELTRVSDTRGLERFSRIKARTKGGAVFTVDVDEPDTTPEKSAPILLKRAKELDAILKLEG